MKKKLINSPVPLDVQIKLFKFKKLMSLTFKVWVKRSFNVLMKFAIRFWNIRRHWIIWKYANFQMTKREINLKIIVRKRRLKKMMKQIKASNLTFRKNHKKKKLRTKLSEKIRTKTKIKKLPSPKTFMI